MRHNFELKLPVFLSLSLFHSVSMEVVACEGGVALKRWRDPPASVVVPAAVEGRRVCAVLEDCF